MRKFYLIMLVAFAIVAATSCTKELVTVDAEQGDVQKGKVAMVFEVTIDENTKAALSDDLKVSFVDNDEVAVYDGISTEPNKFIVQNASGNTAVISGTVSEGAQNFQAVYPFSQAAGLQNGVLTINVPSTQEISAGKNYDPRALVSIASATADSPLKFKNVVSLLKFSISASDVKAVCIKANNGEVLSGALAISDADKTATGEAGVIVLSETTLPAGTYYAAVLPTNLVNGIGVLCQKAGGYDCKISEKAAEIVANSGLNLGTVDGTAFPTELKTKQEFIAFANCADVFDAQYQVKLGADIDMQGAKVNSIKSFVASFDGQEHAIKNLLITDPLFVENNGKISNLVIDETCSVVPSSSFFAPIAYKNLESGVLEKVINKAKCEFKSNEHVDDGALMAGLVVYNLGTLQNCENQGEVTYMISATSGPWGIAGLVATNGGKLKSCTNNAKITSSAYCCLEKKKIGELGFSATGCTGGLVAYSYDGGTIEDSTNDGNIYYDVTSIHLPQASVNRNQVAGIVAAPNGDITNCVNNGNIIANALKDLTMENKEYILGVAGISGGDYFAANSQSNTNITDCTNNGSITVTCDHAGSNNTIGGIVAWPCAEATASNVVTSNCINYGDIKIEGTLKCRVGGIQGGSGILSNCTNYGNISLGKDVNTGSAVGSLCGFHSNGFNITDCCAYGTITSLSDLAGMGGITGAIGNSAQTTGTGCKVNCELTAPSAATEIGLIVGHFNGTSKAITLGTESDPIKVAGKVNGTTITQDNYLGYISSSSNYTPSKHTIFITYGE
ncbi:MAG: hypothetical protein KBS95_04420 [Alistipes sp.]|nr:hypothetical protein [Candidatus Alistipes equi]